MHLLPVHRGQIFLNVCFFKNHFSLVPITSILVFLVLLPEPQDSAAKETARVPRTRPAPRPPDARRTTAASRAVHQQHCLLLYGRLLFFSLLFFFAFRLLISSLIISAGVDEVACSVVTSFLFSCTYFPPFFLFFFFLTLFLVVYLFSPFFFNPGASCRNASSPLLLNPHFTVQHEFGPPCRVFVLSGLIESSGCTWCTCCTP